MIDANHALALPSLRAAVESALDDGIYYQTDFNDACRAAWATALPAVDDRQPTLQVETGCTHADRKDRVQALIEALRSRPRGAWAVVVQPQVGGKPWYTGMMHNGAGQVMVRTDGWEAEPTYAELLRRMVGYEIYSARGEVESQRQVAASVADIEAMGLVAGRVLRNVIVGNDAFSTATVDGIDRAQGLVRMTGIKRGSARRYALSTRPGRIRSLVSDLRTGT